jgi:hypothetical protein
MHANHATKGKSKTKGERRSCTQTKCCTATHYLGKGIKGRKAGVAGKHFSLERKLLSMKVAWECRKG